MRLTSKRDLDANVEQGEERQEMQRTQAEHLLVLASAGVVSRGFFMAGRLACLSETIFADDSSVGQSTR